MVIVSLSSVVCALAYGEKSEVVYTGIFKIESQEVKFRAFYLSAPAGLFEVKLSVSMGTIKWTPHSDVMVEESWLVSIPNKREILWRDSQVGMQKQTTES